MGESTNERDYPMKRARYALPTTGRFLPFFVLPGLVLLASTASAGVNTWTTNGPEVGNILALAIDPSSPATLYAGAGNGGAFKTNGVFKTTNGGETWTSPSAQLGNSDVFALAVDPSTPSTLYASTMSLSDFPDSLNKSTDGGVTWTESLTGHDVYALAFDPSAPATVYAGTGDEGVLRSTDGGVSWNPVKAGAVDQPGPYVVALAIDPTAPATIYASTGAAVFKSTDGGGTWTKSVGGNAVGSFAIDPSAPATIYAGTGGNGVLKSTDGGVNWSPVNAGLTGYNVAALAIDPSTPTTLYAGTLDAGVFRSTDAGGSWTPINAGLGSLAVNALAIDPSTPTRLYAGTGSGVYEVDDYRDIAPCAPGPTTLCLSGGRFKVTTQWTTLDGSSGAGQAVAVAGGDTGYFTFFDSGNVEVAVKILNGCGSNGSFWTFAGGLTDVGVVMTVTDSLTGTVKTYTNSEGTPFRPILDTGAFETCAAGATGGVRPYDASGAGWLAPGVVGSSVERATEPCVPGSTTLCLSDSRYQVRAQWVASSGASGAGHVINLTADTGAFWFFSPSNVEAVIKVLNGCGFNSRYWTFAAGLTDVNVILTVTDTQTGTVQTYTNPQGIPFEPIQDTNAFATCP
jgi:photosystem II stability/assembly factor-like uncharacterized protein